MSVHEYARREAVYVERDCVIELEGHTFEAGGAVVTPDRIIAYPAEDGELRTWHGERIGTWRAVSSWTQPQPGAWGCPKVYAIRATVNGAHYHGRGLGVGMIFRGRRVAAELRSA